MELKLDRKETEDILLAWAEQKWPGQFNTVAVGGKHHYFSETLLTFEHPAEKEESA